MKAIKARVAVIKPNKLTFVCAFFLRVFAAAAFAVLHFYDCLVPADFGVISPYLPFAVVGAFALWAVPPLLKLLRQRVEIFETGIVISKLIGRKQLLFEEIDRFEWSSWSLRGLPFVKTLQCVIYGKAKPDYPLAVLNSKNFGKLKKNMLALEDKLGI